MLAPVGKLTKQLQTESYPPGTFLMNLCECVQTLRTMDNPLALELKKDLEDRATKITSSIQFKAACYMDPHIMNKRAKYFNEADQNLIEVRFLIIDIFHS